MPAPVITIDGPSGSGKGTISRRVAERLGWHLLDSGALYRLVAFGAQQAGQPPEDEAAHARFAGQMVVVFGTRPDGGEQVLLGADRQDVTDLIRSEKAGQALPGLPPGPACAPPCWRASAAWPRPRVWLPMEGTWEPSFSLAPASRST